jgi:hypothetical protein
VITPRQSRQFFDGLWLGNGEFCLHSILRWFVPNQQLRYRGQTTRLTDTLWMATEEFSLSRTGVRARKTFIEIVGPDRLHMTSDDIPGGADILLQERGFRFTPYLFRSRLARGYLVVRCVDEARLDEEAVLHDQIKMYYAGFHVATATMAINIDRTQSAATQGTG